MSGSIRGPDSTCLTGPAPELIAFLRQSPQLQEHLAIAKLHPDGFVARVKIKGSFDKEKEFHMASSSDREQHVVYVKQGWEEMACVKPLDLFKYDCSFGRELTQYKEMFGEHAEPQQAADADANKDVDA